MSNDDSPTRFRSINLKLRHSMLIQLDELVKANARDGRHVPRAELIRRAVAELLSHYTYSENR